MCVVNIFSSTEPIVFSDSYFGDGIYPIIYSNMGCGGWESNVIKECKKQTYNDFFCTRDNIAGVLCGYGNTLTDTN